MNRDVSGQICPSCDTGKHTYLLDPKEPFCPYLHHKADSDKHVAMVSKELETEENEQCKHLGEGYIKLIKDVGSREALKGG